MPMREFCAYNKNCLRPWLAAQIGGYACGLSPRFSHPPRSAPGIDAVAPRAPARPRPNVGPRSSWPSRCRCSMSTHLIAA
jgi:hypothetical protein